MESVFGFQGYGLTAGIIFAYISIAFNLAVKSLLVLGAIAVFKHLSSFTRLCLLIGSVLLFLSSTLTSAIAHVLFVRIFTHAQYAYFMIATGFISSIGFLIFAIGFYQLSHKFVRLKLHLFRE